MSREETLKKMKAMKTKAKKARAEGKKELAASFKSGARRLQRELKATAPKAAPKAEAAPAA